MFSMNLNKRDRTKKENKKTQKGVSFRRRFMSDDKYF